MNVRLVVRSLVLLVFLPLRGTSRLESKAMVYHEDSIFVWMSRSLFFLRGIWLFSLHGGLRL